MKITLFRPALLLAPLVLLPGCLVTQSGSLEVLNPKQAYGRTVAIVGDLHGENANIEKRLASDLQKALAKRGLAVADNPAKAEIVIVPTLGRMRDRTVPPVSPADAGESTEQVVAAPPAETRPFQRLSSANAITRGDLISRRAVPSARAPAGAQQAGLLLTGYRGEDLRDYGTGRRSLPPVWRIYVSQPAVQMKWNSVAVPLINAAANAAKPLSEGKTKKEEGKAKREIEEKPESRVSGNESQGKKKSSSEPYEAEAPPKKRTFLGLFGGSAEQADDR